MSEITYIRLTNLYPHPKNPRKDLGDLTELADSIKAKGVLQNLTVVPKEEGEGDYTVVIGHRRSAAAKLAGFDIVPCVITEMSEEEQIATMLLENMQRSDLTVYEQAQGIQMMMDLDMSVESISEKTGFSESTVRRRVKLLELDKEKFEEATGRGATLMDFAELEKIKDVEKRNELLKHIGTNNFDYQLRSAVDAQNRAEKHREIEETLATFAEKTDDDAGLKYVKAIYDKDDLNEAMSEKSADYKYFYIPAGDYSPAKLYREYTDEEIDEQDAERAENEMHREKISARCDGLRDVSKRAYELRREAIYAISNSHAKKHFADIMTFLFETAISKAQYWNSDFIDCEQVFNICGITDGDIDGIEDLDGDELLETVMPRIKAFAAKYPEQALLRTAYEYFEDGEGERYFDNFSATHEENADLDRLYAFLTKLGYEMSDDEKALQDGTHELFMNAEE